MRRTTRRDFLKNTAAGVAGVTTLGVASIAAPGRVLGANERFRMAVAGLNGRGNSHIGGFSGQDGVDLIYLVEPDQKVLDRRLAEVQKRVGDRYEVKGVADVRKALDDKSVNALSVATPNHWHSLMTIWAAQAGQALSTLRSRCQPRCLRRAVSRIEAQKKYGVVIQHGTQRRSSSQVSPGCMKPSKAGKFGKLKISYGYCCKPRRRDWI